MGDSDGVVGRGRPEGADWEAKGDFGMVKDGLGVPFTGRGELAEIDTLGGRLARDGRGVDVGEAIPALGPAEGTPSMGALDTEEAFE